MKAANTPCLKKSNAFIQIKKAGRFPRFFYFLKIIYRDTTNFRVNSISFSK